MLGAEPGARFFITKHGMMLLSVCLDDFANIVSGLFKVRHPVAVLPDVAFAGIVPGKGKLNVPVEFL